MKSLTDTLINERIRIDDVDMYGAYGLIVQHRDIDGPNKKKIIEHIPYSSTPLDFSDLYGDEAFEERNLAYTLILAPEYRTERHSELPKAQLTNFLMRKKQFKLYDETFPGYYFLAELREGPSFDQNRFISMMTINMTAYPFRIDELPEGNDIWDDFNFELDVAQQTKFDVQGSRIVTLINNGIPSLHPQIVSSASMSLIHNGIEYRLNAGTYSDHDFKLFSGENRITIRGNGNIKFNFHKELI